MRQLRIIILSQQSWCGALVQWLARTRWSFVGQRIGTEFVLRMKKNIVQVVVLCLPLDVLREEGRNGDIYIFMLVSQSLMSNWNILYVHATCQHKILTRYTRRGVAVDCISAPDECRGPSRLNDGPKHIWQLLRIAAAKSYSAQGHLDFLES